MVRTSRRRRGVIARRSRYRRRRSSTAITRRRRVRTTRRRPAFRRRSARRSTRRSFRRARVGYGLNHTELKVAIVDRQVTMVHLAGFDTSIGGVSGTYFKDYIPFPILGTGMDQRIGSKFRHVKLRCYLRFQQQVDGESLTGGGTPLGITYVPDLTVRYAICMTNPNTSVYEATGSLGVFGLSVYDSAPPAFVGIHTHQMLGLGTNWRDTAAYLNDYLDWVPASDLRQLRLTPRYFKVLKSGVLHSRMTRSQMTNHPPHTGVTSDSGLWTRATAPVTRFTLDLTKYAGSRCEASLAQNSADSVVLRPNRGSHIFFMFWTDLPPGINYNAYATGNVCREQGFGGNLRFSFRYNYADG